MEMSSHRLILTSGRVPGTYPTRQLLELDSLFKKHPKEGAVSPEHLSLPPLLPLSQFVFSSAGLLPSYFMKSQILSKVV